MRNLFQKNKKSTPSRGDISLRDVITFQIGLKKNELQLHLTINASHPHMFSKYPSIPLQPISTLLMQRMVNT